MSFDLFLTHFRHGDSHATAREPVLQALRRQPGLQTDGDGFYNLEFADGGTVTLNASGLEAETETPFTNCMFHMRSFSPDVIAFVHEIAVAGDMTALNLQGEDSPDGDNPSVVVFAESQFAHLPEGLTEHPHLVDSPHTLGRCLGFSGAQWQEYRDKATGAQPE